MCFIEFPTSSIGASMTRALERSQQVKNARAFLAEQAHGENFAGLDEHGRPVYRGKTRIPKVKRKSQ